MRRSVSFGVSGLATMVMGSLLFIACSGDGETDRPDDETGGAGGTGTGGSSGGGMGGSAMGGASGSAMGGTSGTGGASCVAPETECTSCTPAECEVVKPPQALITDFSNLFNGRIFGAKDENGDIIDNWYTPPSFFGGMYVYPVLPTMCSEDMTVPTHPLASDPCDDNWHITGTVGTYSGFGLWLETCMIDMSDYSGISFRIGGEVGPTGKLKVQINHSANIAPDACKTNKGTCMEADCAPASATIDVSSTSNVVSLEWSDFTGGVPEDTVNPAEITGIGFALDCADCMASPYELDVTIDDVMLIE